MRATVERPWIARAADTSDGRLRLFCFPPAGLGVAEFRRWPLGLPSAVQVVAVQLPGRASRPDEPLYVSLMPLVTALQESLQPDLRDPFALFGHSMGALIAYELARRLHASGRPTPMRLYVSGHRAPHLPCRQPSVHDAPEDRFVDELRRLGGTPEAVLRDADMRELMLPVLRADFAIAETYVHVPGRQLECPVVALGGRDDPLVAEAEIAAWRETTTGPFAHHMLPGDHFFPERARERVLDILAADLRGALAEVPPR